MTRHVKRSAHAHARCGGTGRHGHAARGATAARASRTDRGAARPDRMVPAPDLRPKERALRAAARRAATASGSIAGRADAGGAGNARARAGRARAQATPCPQRLHRRRRQRTVLRRGPGAGGQHRGAQPRSAGPERRAVHRAVRDRRPEGQPPPGAAPGRLRGAEVRTTGDQAPRHPNPALPAGAGGRHRGQPRRRELHRRRDGRQVPVASAAVPPAPAADRSRLQAQPALVDAAGGSRRAVAGADLRRAARIDPAQPRQGGGRNTDQGRPGRTGQDEGGLLLAGVRRAGRGVLPVLRVAPARLREGTAGRQGAAGRGAAQATAMRPTAATPKPPA